MGDDSNARRYFGAVAALVSAGLVLHVPAPRGHRVGGVRSPWALDSRVVRLAVLPPVAWLVFALARGSFVQDVNGNHCYAYPS